MDRVLAYGAAKKHALDIAASIEEEQIERELLELRAEVAGLRSALDERVGRIVELTMALDRARGLT